MSVGALLAAVSRPKRFDLKSVAFPQQLKFIADSARLKALFCTRRAAKSYTGGLYLIQEALANPGCNCLFIGLTRLSAHGIVWKDILKVIDRQFSLNIKFNETLLTATLPNGSVIYVAGADTDESEMNKLLGKKYRLVILDEASMFSVNMHQLVYGILKPATADNRGTICLLGTASNITRGLFYDITTKREPGWSLHTWTAHDNPHVAKQWQEELDEIENLRPLFKLTPLYKQWMLNEWCLDSEALVYKFDERINKALRVPVYETGYQYVLGIDLGHFPDPTAFVIGKYHPANPVLYFIHAETHLRMDVTDVANHIRQLERVYTFDVKVIDGSMKMAIEEMNARHKSNVIPADKHGKVDFINLMNAELIQQKIMLLPEAKALEDEFKTLIWQTDNGVIKEPRKEHPGLPNHCSDGALYAWRHCYQYLWSKPEPVIKWDSQERWEGDHVERLRKQVEAEKNPNHFDAEFQPDTDLFNFDLDDKT